MMKAILLAFVLLTAQDRPTDPLVELAAARKLYLSAAYEEALEKLSRVGQRENLVDQVDTYRALCLLALGQISESERVLERIFLRNPGYSLDEIEVSPRLVLVFQGVRARALPSAARNLYAAARISFDDKKYDVASAQLRDLLVVINPANVPDSAIGVAELRTLAEGFLKLSESFMVRPEPTPAPTPTSTPIPTATPTAPVPPSRVTGPPSPQTSEPLYSMLDRDVIAPVEISRPVPTWQAPRGTPKGLYQGVVELVINSQGRVESAIMRKSISPDYDPDLLLMTEHWRFQPATLNGLPVKYRRSYEVIVHSR